MASLFYVMLSARYRVADNVNLPLRIIPAVHEEGRARVNINLKVSADFSYKLFGSNIVVKVRVKKTPAGAKLHEHGFTCGRHVTRCANVRTLR